MKINKQWKDKGTKHLVKAYMLSRQVAIATLWVAPPSAIIFNALAPKIYYEPIEYPTDIMED